MHKITFEFLALLSKKKAFVFFWMEECVITLLYLKLTSFMQIGLQQVYINVQCFYKNTLYKKTEARITQKLRII